MVKGKIIGIMSFKGGVGKTVSTINIGAALTKLGKKTIIVDANFLSPTLNVYMGLLDPEVTLKEVVEDNVMPEEAIYEHESGVHVLPTNFYRKIDLDKFVEKMEYLRELYDYILLDSGPTYTEEIVAVLMAVDELIFVTTPDYPTLVSTLRAAELTKNENVNVRGILVNKKRRKSFELDQRDIEETIGLPVIGEINDDNKIMRSASRFMPITHHSPKNKNSKRYIELAKQISEEDPEKQLSRLLKNVKLDEE